MKGSTDGFRVEKIFFFSEPRIAVTGVFMRPPAETAPVRTDIVLFDKGTSEGPERVDWIRKRLNAGVQLFLYDVRGTGAVAQRHFKPDREPYTAAYKMACDAMMLGVSTTGMRVLDALRAYDYLKTRADVDEIGMVGFERGAVYAYYAAALETGIACVQLHDMLCSYQSLIETRYYDRARYHLDILPYGALSAFDLGNLLPCFEGRGIELISPRTATGDPMSDTELERLFWSKK